MKRFSNNEKIVIRSIVQQGKHNYSYVLINAYQDLFYRKKVEYDHNKHALIFYVNGVDYVDQEVFLSFEDTIMEISLLLDNLEENRYIYLIEDPGTNQLTSTGGFIKDGLTPVTKIIDPKIDKILFDALNHRIFVSSDLTQLVEDDFELYEDKMLKEAKQQTQAANDQAQSASVQAKESKKQTRNSWIAIVISILAIIASVIVSVVTVTKVKIVEDQFKSIEALSVSSETSDALSVIDTTKLDTLSAK